MFSVKLSRFIGAELSGVNLTSDLDKSVLDEIEKLLLEHEVIFLEIKIFLGNNIKKLLNTLDHPISSSL